MVTDSEFKTPWFRSVILIGWDFIGRVGDHIMVSLQGEVGWERTDDIFATATGHVRY